MDQGYSVIGPSPGAKSPIYPSFLPLTCGNLLSNIFPKSHEKFSLSYCPVVIPEFLEYVLFKALQEVAILLSNKFSILLPIATNDDTDHLYTPFMVNIVLTDVVSVPVDNIKFAVVSMSIILTGAKRELPSILFAISVPRDVVVS
jgi:hypothetical protein